jgi:lipopolysaccharide/colanic/teichoic acid biosynthesis glycosyltransferase
MQQMVVDAFTASGYLDSESFYHQLYLEQRRIERSRARFVLMLFDCSALLKHSGDAIICQVLTALSTTTRETDVRGQYDRSGIGIIFNEIPPGDGHAALRAILTKVTNALSGALRIDQIHEVRLSFHVFPEDWDQHSSLFPPSLALYSPLGKTSRQRIALAVKRFIDVTGSLFALLLFSPLFVAIAIIIKATSPGPILFCQERVGQYGRRFTFLKFRSMFATTTQTVHEEFVKRFISSELVSPSGHDVEEAPYKMKNDPRITSFGRFIRRTSIDELPQFFNVLKGDMSLVGPRPPIPYEVKCYNVWHRRRLLWLKPGITGLWQVKGRSRVGFDEMVRLDLQYATNWSLWLDLTILLQTPRAVLSGTGAY